jgi:hypothetical protein
MPVIRIACPDDDPEAPNPAAAAMAATLAMASAQIPQLPPMGKIPRHEKTRPKNPNRLTIKQHVFPVRSIEPFVGQSGCVAVFDTVRGKLRPARPRDEIFCAQRAWDQQTETAMGRIEDAFQGIVYPIIRGKVDAIEPEQKPAINTMFALWCTRTRYRWLDAQEVQLVGIPGSDLTKAQEENLESNGYLFARMGGKMPARQVNGVQLLMRVHQYARELAALNERWGVVRAQSGEFLVPDVPTHTIIPLSPKLALVAPALDGTIIEQTVAEINSALKAGSRAYYFARDLSKCPVFPATPTC